MEGDVQRLGRLVLDGLQFRLPADRPPAIAVLPGGGHFELRNAVVTFEDGEDLSAVVLDDPKNQMMMGTDPRMPIPKVVVENTLLRGKGRLLGVTVSRPFELDVKNTLAALDGTLIDIDPAAADASASGIGHVRLNRVTTYLGESLIRSGARPPAGRRDGRTGEDRRRGEPLFVPAGREARRRSSARTSWTPRTRSAGTSSGRARGTYGYDKKKVLLELRPAELPVMPAKTIEGDEWLKFAAEDAGDPFLTVHFQIRPPAAGTAKAFALVRPRDFEKRSFDRADASPECGADIGHLPQPLE